MGSKWGLALRDAARALAARRSHSDGTEELGDEAGFTLIELMVVLLIMGILMAIAIPTFLGAANGAHDRASQSDLTNAMTSAKSLYAQDGSYPKTATKPATALHAIEPEMTFKGTSTTLATHLSVKTTTTGNFLFLASYSGTTKHCWLAVDNESDATSSGGVPPGISYGLKATVSKAATCKATTTPTAKVTGTKVWGRQYPKT